MSLNLYAWVDETEKAMKSSGTLDSLTHSLPGSPLKIFSSAMMERMGKKIWWFQLNHLFQIINENPKGKIRKESAEKLQMDSLEISLVLKSFEDFVSRIVNDVYVGEKKNESKWEKQPLFFRSTMPWSPSGLPCRPLILSSSNVSKKIGEVYPPGFRNSLR